MKRNRATELRRAQRNLLALSGFKWRRDEPGRNINGTWQITKHDWQWSDGDHGYVHCNEPIEDTQGEIDAWEAFNGN